MRKNETKPKWKLIKEELMDVGLPDSAQYHLIITDKMFQKVAKFSKSDEGVAYSVGKIIEAGIKILRKITQRNYNWKVFQHLKPEIEDENEPEIVMTKHNSKTKVRKHKNHHLLIQMPYPIFNEIKYNHARINTFSMALLSRIIIELFLSIYDQCNDFNAAIQKMAEVISEFYKGQDFEKCEAKIKIYIEYDENDTQNRRRVVFFVVNLKSTKLGIDFHYELRL